jgi:ribosome-associated heat shock protein Hsp15
VECDHAAVERVRIDKWLWAARFFKTRGDATEAVAGGHVQVNGARVKPSKDVGAGDRLLIRRGAVEWTVDVRAVAERRGPAKVAAELYEELPESREARERQAVERRLAKPLGADLGSRPTKQARRRIEALRRGAANRRRGR